MNSGSLGIVKEIINAYKNVPSICISDVDTKSHPSKRKRLKNRNKRQARKRNRGK